ncbi:MAG: Na/Pi symporter [Planctomycetota bacterium]|jgi:phosphate:Na+ symporter
MNTKFSKVLIGTITLLSPGLVLAAVELTEVEETAIELAAYVLGGIGIFLIGIHYAGSHLQKITGGSFQNLVTKVSDHPLGMVTSGATLGFMTQSGKAAAFILSDFVQAGMMKVRHAAPIVFWANAGCSLIVFASMVSLRVLALFVLGITALGITFHVPKRLVNGYGALFGLAMIMYGLYLVKTGAAGYAGAGWVGPILQSIHEHYSVAFVVGLVLTLLVQSNLAIIMIVIAFAASGLFSLEESAMSMYGAQAGTGLLTYVFSFHAHGRARQVVVTQIAYDVVATIAFVFLFYLEILSGMPLIFGLARQVSSDVGTQAVAVALIFQFGAALLLLLVRNPILDRISDWFPPSAAEILSKEKFIHARASDSPETALLLIEKEQFRLLERLPKYIDFVRGENGSSQRHHPDAYHEAFAHISSRIGETLSHISGHGLNQVTSDQLIRTTKLEEQLVTLEGIVYRLATHMLEAHDSDRAGELGRNIMESVDFMILTAIDAIESQDASEIETLEMLTQDRSAMMTKIRHNYFESEKDLSNEDRNFVLDITILFENAVHTLGRYGHLLRTA